MLYEYARKNNALSGRCLTGHIPDSSGCAGSARLGRGALNRRKLFDPRVITPRSISAKRTTLSPDAIGAIQISSPVNASLTYIGSSRYRISPLLNTR